jgi:hypothetical protein
MYALYLYNKHIADRYFFLYIYHKSLIQSKVRFFKIRPGEPNYVRFIPVQLTHCGPVFFPLYLSQIINSK